MSNYKQSSVAGDAWVRAVRVVIENPVNGVPAVTFIEEKVINLPDEVIVNPAGNVVEPFTPDNAVEIFNLMHPETGVVIGSANYQDVYVILHSLYLHVATKRDTANSVAQVAP